MPSSVPTPPSGPTTTDPDCIFCGIVAGEVPADVVHRSDRVVAFRDVAPQAPTHVLVVPVAHQPDAAASQAHDPAVVGELVAAAAAVAQQDGLSDYRMVLNTGAGAGQTVFHTHLHLIGGRALTWPPG